MGTIRVSWKHEYSKNCSIDMNVNRRAFIDLEAHSTLKVVLLTSQKGQEYFQTNERQAVNNNSIMQNKKSITQERTLLKNMLLISTKQ